MINRRLNLTLIIKLELMGLLWQSSGKSSTLLLQDVWV